MNGTSNVRHLAIPARLLITREWRRMLSEPSRLMGIALQPLVFLLVFGAGFHESFYFQNGDVRYIAFFYPGILGLVVLFSSIYSTLTLVDDKKCGLFRLVLCGPGGVLGAMLGKLLATLSVGFGQSLLFLLIGLFLPVTLTPTTFLAALVTLFLASAIFSTIGVLCAWILPSASAFHAIMSIFLVPMWLLSGAMFPLNGVFNALSLVNPMAYVVTTLRHILLSATISVSDFFALLVWLMIWVAALYLATKRRALE